MNVALFQLCNMVVLSILWKEIGLNNFYKQLNTIAMRKNTKRENEMNNAICKHRQNYSNFIRTSILLLLLALVMWQCKKDDIPLRKTVYTLTVEDVLGVNGNATFTENDNGNTSIDIVLNNVTPGTYVASLCENSAVEGGAVVASLNPLDMTGESSTVVSVMTYNQLIAYDGHIKILKSTSPELILAIGDIGGNEITVINKSYTLNLIEPYGVSGTALFEKRVNGNTLLSITLSGTIAGASYPATINLGSIASVGGGPIIKTLNNVNGTSGKGYTNIRNLDSGIDIIYDNWLVYDGYINIYQSSANIENIISQGDIGSNME